MIDYCIVLLEEKYPCIVNADDGTILLQPISDPGAGTNDQIRARANTDFMRHIVQQYSEYGNTYFQNHYRLVPVTVLYCGMCAAWDISQEEADRGTTYLNYPLCRDCWNSQVKACAVCDRYFTVHNMRRLSDSSSTGAVYACQECYETECFTCDNCGSVYLTTFCRRCDSGITYYSAKPCLQPVGQGPVYYGIELEVEVAGAQNNRYGERPQEVDEIAGYCKDLFPKDYCIMKEDGSLTAGFEICTRPASVAYHKTAWDNFFANKPKQLRSWRSGHCGIHVHISRRPLTALQIGKMLFLLHDNLSFTQNIAGRCSPYGDFSHKKKITDARFTGMARDGDCRHEALNLTGPETVELRIFRGTLKPEFFWKDIEFTEALVQFTATGQFGISEITPEKFNEFSKHCSKTWPNLAKFLQAPYDGRRHPRRRDNNTYRPPRIPRLSSDSRYTENDVERVAAVNQSLSNAERSYRRFVEDGQLAVDMEDEREISAAEAERRAAPPLTLTRLERAAPIPVPEDSHIRGVDWHYRTSNFNEADFIIDNDNNE